MTSLLLAASLLAASPEPASEGRLAASSSGAEAGGWTDRLLRPTAPLGLALHAELGFLSVVSHHIQLSRGGTDIDYLNDGGQDTLFPFVRLSADVNLFKRNTFVLLYQPLDLTTRQLPLRDLTVDGETFKAGTPVDFGYGFSFWRLSYLYNFFWARPGQELAVGLSLQIRNARITFGSADGTQFRSSLDVGLVPILKARGRYTFENRAFVGAEVDGFYAESPGFNGGTGQVKGAILDASVRAGVELTPMVDGFLNLRTILGGAAGTSKNPRPPNDGYVDNWLYTVSVSIGFSLKTPTRQ